METEMSKQLNVVTNAVDLTVDKYFFNGKTFTMK